LVIQTLYSAQKWRKCLATKRTFQVSCLGYKFETESEDWEGKSAEQIQAAIRAKCEPYFCLFGLKVDEIIIREVGSVRPKEKKV